MRIFIDTNILLDVAQGREPFYNEAAKIVAFAHQAEHQAFLSWHSMATIFYILAKPWGSEKTKAYLTDILVWASLTPTSKALANRALLMEGKDFEDDLQSQCAAAAGCDLIVSRNVKDFGSSPVPCLTPHEFLAQFSR